MTAELAPFEQAYAAAEQGFAPWATALAAQQAKERQCAAAVDHLEMLRQRQAAMPQRVRDDFLRHLSSQPRQSFGGALPQFADLAPWVMRIDRCTRSLAYVADLERQHAELTQTLNESHRLLNREQSEWRRPKKSSRTMTHNGLLWRLGHWNWDLCNAKLDASRRAVRALMEAPKDIEMWAAHHATQPWTWWSVLTMGRFDRLLQPQELLAMRASTPGYQPIESPLKNWAKQQAAAAHAGRSRGGMRRPSDDSSTNFWLFYQQNQLLSEQSMLAGSDDGSDAGSWQGDHPSTQS